MAERIIIFLLRCVAALPLRVLYFLSDIIYFVVYRVVGYRRKVVRRNLTEAFPDKSPKEICKIEKQFYHYMCDIIVETVKLLSISDRQLNNRVEVENTEVVNEAIRQGKSVVLLLGHYGNWEWVQHLSGKLSPGVFQASIYHPLNSPLWDKVYGAIRSRWHVNIIPQAKAVRTLLSKENQPWACGFIADHRPVGPKTDNVTPFLNHATSFIYGPELIGNKTGADFFFLEMQRLKRGRYRITLTPLVPKEDGLPYPVSRAFWEEFERVVKKAPAFWLWSHKRWKFDKLLSPNDQAIAH